MLGGAMYALERGLGMKRLAKAFALFTALATFGIGCGVQVNAISTVLDGNFHIAPLSVGLVCGALTAVVIFGGVKWIARVCEKAGALYGSVLCAGLHLHFMHQL